MQINQVINSDTPESSFTNADTVPDFIITTDSLNPADNISVSGKLQSKSIQFFTSKDTQQDLSVFKKLNSVNNDFIFGVIVLNLIIITWTKFYYSKRLLQIFQAFSGKNYANQFAREGNLFKERIYFPLILFSVISYALLFVLSVRHFGKTINFDFSGIFFLSLITIVSYWLLKSLIIIVLGHIFKTTDSTKDYLLNMHIYFIIGSMLVLPTTSIALYFEPGIFNYASFIILGFIFILWLFRALQIGLGEKHFSKFHLFLYLCTLEFLPIILLAKIILNSNFF